MDVATGGKSVLEGHESWVGTAVRASGDLVLTADYAGHVIAWDCTGERPKPRWNIPAHAQTIYSLAASTNGEQFATGDRDGTIRVWRTSDGQRTHEIAGLASRLRPRLPSRRSAVGVGRPSAEKAASQTLGTRHRKRTTQHRGRSIVGVSARRGYRMGRDPRHHFVLRWRHLGRVWQQRLLGSGVRVTVRPGDRRVEAQAEIDAERLLLLGPISRAGLSDDRWRRHRQRRVTDLGSRAGRIAGRPADPGSLHGDRYPSGRPPVCCDANARQGFLSRFRCAHPFEWS